MVFENNSLCGMDAKLQLLAVTLLSGITFWGAGIIFWGAGTTFWGTGTTFMEEFID